MIKKAFSKWISIHQSVIPSKSLVQIVIFPFLAIHFYVVFLTSRIMIIIIMVLWSAQKRIFHQRRQKKYLSKEEKRDFHIIISDSFSLCYIFPIKDIQKFEFELLLLTSSFSLVLVLQISQRGEAFSVFIGTKAK